ILPPTVTGSIALVIGISLAGVSVTNAVVDGSTGQASNAMWIVALVTLLATVAFSVYLKGVWGQLPILFGILVGYALAIPLGLVDFSGIFAGNIVEAPHFTLPTVSWPALFAIMPIAIATIPESTAHLFQLDLYVNDLAKKKGIITGESIYAAKQKEPRLQTIIADYPKYVSFAKQARKLYSQYSDNVIPFGLDEAWVDVTGAVMNIGEGQMLADEIRARVKYELGLTASVGVSYNYIFSKLASDMKKPDATTVITEENFRDVVWPLSAADLLGVGRATYIKLFRRGIKTIGDIAQTAPEILQGWFGKWGLFLYTYANGTDVSAVKPFDSETAVKSVGNSTTCPRDLESEQDAHIVFQNLSESVAERMRDLGLTAKTVQISLRTNELDWCDRQMSLSRPSMISTELTDAAMTLLRTHYRWEKPLRSIGIRGTNLIPQSEVRQLSIFDDEKKRERMERLEYTIDDIRRRFGHSAVNRALLMSDGRLGRLDAKADHIMHPIGYL
ncbi:MAG: hypothetical protein FWG32_08955, partial [Oscillospiraceae bacterium]|nr:hypothetical protein [Oscillospiraceae bacterium]